VPRRVLAALTWAGVNGLPLALVDRVARSPPAPVRAVWRLLGEDVRARLRGDAFRWFHLRRSAAPPPPGADAPPGLDIVGYVRSEHGIGESARMCAGAAEAAGLPFTVRDFNEGNLARTSDDRLVARLAPARHNVTLWHVNADQLPLAMAARGPGRTNIAYWHWELPEFPDAWVAAAEPLDEIWVPSTFVLEAVSAKVARPVVRIPHAIAFDVEPGALRAAWGVPDGVFAFLTVCDALSVLERKNPAGAIEAYRRAFPSPGSTALVVKVNNGRHAPAEVERLRALAGGRPDILVVDRIASRAEMLQLIALCDATVSLHRAEGFGLPLAEAMYLGKPVIATGWSGNTDFTTPRNALLVDHELRALERDHGPYPRGATWAEPDLAHAVYIMQEVARTPELAARVGAAGRQTVRTQLAPEVVGRRYRERLAWLAKPFARRGIPWLDPSNKR